MRRGEHLTCVLFLTLLGGCQTAQTVPTQTAASQKPMERQLQTSPAKAFVDAAARGDVVAVENLWDQAITENSKTGSDALIAASTNGYINVVHALLARGAGLGFGTTDSDRSPLTALNGASKNGHLDVVRALLTAGANPNNYMDGSRPLLARTPLMWASLNGHLDVVKTLIDAGANLNLEYIPPSSYYVQFNSGARAYGGPTATAAQLASRFPPGTTTINHGYGETALGLAKQNMHEDIVELLAKAGAEP